MSNDKNKAKTQRRFGTIDLADIRAVSGLELLRGIRDGLYPEPTMSRTLNFHMTELEEGIAEFKGYPDYSIYNPLGKVHGGYFATLLDSALGCAVHTLCPAGYGSVTVEMKLNMVRPMSADTGPVFARATVVHPGRQLATSEGRLVDQNGKLYAHGTQTCSILKLPAD